MKGDLSDMLNRLKQLLPVRWFADKTPNLDALLGGLGKAWSDIYSLLNEVLTQTRIKTATGIFLDIAAQDYFGTLLPRKSGEGDHSYSRRILQNLLAPRATRSGLSEVLLGLTGRNPVIFEPLNATDTGGYNISGGYCVVGGYGCNSIPYQFFVTAYRPVDLPTSHLGGYGLGPGGYCAAPMFYASTWQLSGNVSDTDIYAAIEAVIPTASVAWTRISN